MQWTGHSAPVRLDNSADLQAYYDGFTDAESARIYNPPRDTVARVYYHIGFKVQRGERVDPVVFPQRWLKWRI